MRFIVIIVVALFLLSSDKEPKPELTITPVIRPVLPWRAELDDLKALLKELDELRQENDELQQENGKLKAKLVVSTPPFQPSVQQAAAVDAKKPSRRSSQVRFPLLRRVFRR
tara:strand:+ start:131 stop:466 length:336 start_codon:yes stop_codon:yes gene_type:complete